MKSETGLLEAQETLIRIATQRASIIDARSLLSSRLEQVEGTAGERYLAGDRSAASEIIEIRTELDLTERAIAVLDNQEAAGQTDLKRATAADMRLRARAKQAELDGLTKKTSKFLAELSKLEGVEFGQCVLSEQRIGTWFENFKGVELAPDYLPARECIREPIGDNAGGFAVPHSARLREEIKQLNLDAEKIETALANTELPVSGEVSRWGFR